jgi:hypothetical protein
VRTVSDPFLHLGGALLISYLLCLGLMSIVSDMFIYFWRRGLEEAQLEWAQELVREDVMKFERQTCFVYPKPTHDRLCNNNMAQKPVQPLHHSLPLYPKITCPNSRHDIKHVTFARHDFQLNINMI